MSELRLDRPSGIGLMAINAAVAPAAALGVAIAISLALHGSAGVAWDELIGLAAIVGMVSAALAVAWLVSMGIVGAVGRLAGWTQAWGKARTICSHATAVWPATLMLGPLIFALGLASIYLGLWAESLRWGLWFVGMLNLTTLFAPPVVCLVWYGLLVWTGCEAVGRRYVP